MGAASPLYTLAGPMGDEFEEPASFTDVLSLFQKLQNMRENAVSINLECVKEEDSRLKTNPKYRSRLLRKQRDAEDYFARKEAQEEGLDYERAQALNWTALEVADWNRKEAERVSRMDTGFTDYNQAAFRKYNRLTAAINPDAIANMTPDSESAKTNMADDLQEQLSTRAKFSKRRHFNADSDVTYINQRNMRFNEKLARAFDKYTQETKDNLERGTAL